MNEILDKRKLRKITCEWDEKNTKKLIKCVRNNRILWDSQHHDYKNRATREWEWRLIGAEIFCNENSGGEVCIKWQNLRSQYNNYSKKYKYGNNNNKNIRWKYFNMLDFLSSSTDVILPPPAYNFESTMTPSVSTIEFEEQKNPGYQESYTSIESESTGKTGSIETDNIPTPAVYITNNSNKLQEFSETTSAMNNIINNSHKLQEFADTIAINITNNSNKLQEFSDTTTAMNNTTSKSHKLQEFADTDYLQCNRKSFISDEYSDFGKFVANELRNLQYANDLQSKLKRQIQRYIVDIADEYALRLNSLKSVNKIKPDLSLTRTTASSSSIATTSNDYFTECKVEMED